MSIPLAIQGIGMVGGFGLGNESACLALESGRDSPNETLPVPMPEGVVLYPVYTADPAPLKNFISSGKLRRINKYSQLATLAACLALRDAGYSIPPEDSNLAVIVASGYGASSTTFQFLDNVILEGDEFASPTRFSNSVHSSAASHLTILMQIQGPCLTVTQFEMSTVSALLTAQIWLTEKRVDTVLIGNVEEINPVLLYCYNSFWENNVPARIEPLHFQRQTAIPGEGSAFMVLTRDEGKMPVYGYMDEISWTQASKYSFPREATIIPGADGHRACGLKYKKLLRNIKPENIKTFSQFTGSMPSGQMFDIALAFLAARKGLISHHFCSWKLDAEDNLGIVTCKAVASLIQ